MTRLSQSLPLALIAACAVSACATMPAKLPEELRLNESPLEIRTLQSRRFRAPSEKEILAATIAVLQDMEYNIDRVESALGVITASKVSDADSGQEQLGLLAIDLLCALGGGDCGALASASDEQLIMLTLVVLPSLANRDEYIARVTLQRIVVDTMNRVKVKELVDEPEIYQQIFDRLSKSLFLEIET